MSRVYSVCGDGGCRVCCLWRWWESVCGDGGCRVQVLMEMVGVVFVGMVGVVCRF